MSVRFVNNFSAALTAGIDSDDTTLLFAAGVGDTFRAKLGSALGSDHVYITVYNAGGDVEYMKVTATTGDDFTVVRGQDNTTARAWLSGDMAAVRPNAAALQEAVSLPTDLARSGINLDITEMRGLTTPLSVLQGGTGSTSLAALTTALGVKVGTDVMAHVAPGAPGNVLTSVDDAWVSSPPATPVALSTAAGAAPSYAARAFACFNGATGAIRSAGNATVTRNSTGDYTVAFTTALPDANYAVVFGQSGTGGNGYSAQIRSDLSTPTASGFRFQVTTVGGTPYDPSHMNFVVYR